MPRRARLRPRDLARADSRRGKAGSSPSPGPRPTTTRSSSEGMRQSSRRRSGGTRHGEARRLGRKRGNAHLAERGGDTERRRGFQRALNHEHRVCASRATRSVSPPTEERRFFAKLLQHDALFASAPKEKIASVFSVFFCLKRVQCSAEVDDCSTARKLGNNPIAARCFGVVSSPLTRTFQSARRLR